MERDWSVSTDSLIHSVHMFHSHHLSKFFYRFDWMPLEVCYTITVSSYHGRILMLIYWTILLLVFLILCISSCIYCKLMQHSSTYAYCEGQGFILYFPLPPAHWKGGFKGWCLNRDRAALCLTARWDFFQTDLTERQTGSVWVTGVEGEAPSQWESSDLMS